MEGSESMRKMEGSEVKQTHRSKKGHPKEEKITRNEEKTQIQ